jgi:DNA-binding response OmpR family regulator
MNLNSDPSEASNSAVCPVEVPETSPGDKSCQKKSKLPEGQKILVVDDDIPLGKFLSRELKSRHFLVEVNHDGETACASLEQSAFDLVILDWNLPKMSGMGVIKQIRPIQPSLPMLVLTARNRTEDVVSALQQGADDCLLRRNSTSTTLVTSSKVGNLSINREEHWVMRGERRIDLTAREFVLLDYLMNNVGKPVSRATLMREVWNIAIDSTSNIVDVYMKYLRDKIDSDEEVKLIRTVRGVGYVLSND